MADWIVGFIQDTGYAGIALLMLLENVFPPIPSELILPFAGYVAASAARKTGSSATGHRPSRSGASSPPCAA